MNCLTLGFCKLFFNVLVLLALSGLFPVHALQVTNAQSIPQQVQHPIIYRLSSPSTSGSPPFVPTDIWKAYDYLPLYSRGVNGNGTRIAIIDAFGDRSLSSDLSIFDLATGLKSSTLKLYYPDGIPTTTNSGWALETALDVEWAHAIAPNATIDVVVAVNSNLGSVFDAISYVANSLPSENVLSMSFGLSESSYPLTGPYTISATHQLFVTIASHGTTLFASSGDSGASSCCDAGYPASDPLVTAVGGTSLTLNSDSSYSGETAWSGSSAGSSIVFSKPSWQQGRGDSMRDITDVSYDADPNTGVLVVQNGREFVVGGTSAGSPQWAGLLALASQANRMTYGSVNQKLYNISAYHDVTVGSDGFFNATAGWDYPTGLGSPDANAVVSALAPGIPVAVNNTVSFHGFNVTSLGTLSLNMSSSTFSGAVTVSASNATTGSVLSSRIYGLWSLSLQNTTSPMQSTFLLNVAVSPYPLSLILTLVSRNGNVTVSFQVARQVDFAGNGFVSINDASVVYRDYGAVLGGPGYDPRADLDASGVISLIDVGVVDFLYSCPSFT